MCLELLFAMISDMNYGTSKYWSNVVFCDISFALFVENALCAFWNRHWIILNASCPKSDWG
ncbi:hypothetical protein DPMN_045225 [Dreissena polymorpha]|uniref:Uncharacterized protein n=1 Tax=Dreissena polymorpha TaxID=45954 RepID=A0A9D4D4G9_DREPO|nr:hypothetical protein DPMN_045225 [Dreissena polymorpha]